MVHQFATSESYLFIGTTVDGKWYGEGKWVHRNGANYEGQWVDSKKNGQGKFCYSNGAVYIGSWHEDKKHGHGVYYHPNGSVYTGEFKDDKKHGNGTLVLLNGDEYIGTFENGEWSGGIISKGLPKSQDHNNIVEAKAVSCFEISRQDSQDDFSIPLLDSRF